MSAGALFGTALDAIWQGILVCTLVAAGLRFAPRSSAATRSAIWSAALVACLAAAFVDVAVRHPSTVVVPMAASRHGSADAARPHGGSVSREVRIGPSVSGPPKISPAERIAALASRAVRPILLFVLLIAVARCGMLTFEVLAVLRARRLVTHIETPFDDLPPVRRRYAFASSATAATPHVLGFGPPLVVLPSALLDQPRERVRSVVLHELAHVRRYDDVRGALEALLAAVVWWDPGVRFALGRIARLRERICDDAAIEATRDRLGYATVLADIARSAVATVGAVPCFSRRDMVLERVRAILDASVDRASRPDRKLVAGAVLVTALLVTTTARFHVPVLADPVSVSSSMSQAGDRDSDIDMHFNSSGTPEAPAVIRGTWKLASCASVGKLRLGVAFAAQSAAGSESWNETACVPDAEFRGISAAALASAAGEASFSVVRSAGTFDATGHFGDGRGAGTYAFSPSAGFLARIRALGIGTLTNDQLFALTIADFQDSELDALAAHGYAKPTPDELVRLAYVDANQTFVLKAIELPAKTKTVSQLLMLAERGIRADDITAIETYGYHPTLEQFIRLADFGVRPPYIARLRASGYTDTNVDDLIKLRELGG